MNLTIKRLASLALATTFVLLALATVVALALAASLLIAGFYLDVTGYAAAPSQPSLVTRYLFWAGVFGAIWAVGTVACVWLLDVEDEATVRAATSDGGNL